MLSARRHHGLLDRSRSAVLVIDVQEGFRGYIPTFEQVTAQIRLLVAGALRIGVPVAASEQYPRGLGSAVPELELPAGTPTLEKLEFAACDTDAWDELPLGVRSADQFVLAGLEAHVCVRHTALELLAAGRDVQVVVDGVASHTDLHRDTSLAALEQAGARLTTVEQVLFDWLGVAGTPEFRDVQALLKQHAAG